MTSVAVAVQGKPDFGVVESLPPLQYYMASEPHGVPNDVKGR